MRKFVCKKVAKSKLSSAQWEPRNCLFIELIPDVLDKNNGQEENMKYFHILCNLYFNLIIQISQHVCYNIWISWEKGGNGIWKFQIGIHNGSRMTGITLLCTINYHYQRRYYLIGKEVKASYLRNTLQWSAWLVCSLLWEERLISQEGCYY